MRPVNLPSLSRPAAVVAAVAVALSATAGTVRAATTDDVTVSADGHTVHVSAHSGDDARRAVARAGVTLGDHDRVIPTGQIHRGDTVTVTRAHAYTLTLDGATSTQWSADETVGQALRDLLGTRLTVAAVDTAGDLPLYPDAVSVTVSTRKHATIRLAGKTRRVVSNATTVEGLLKDAHVTLGGRDVALPGPDATVTDGMSVAVNKLAPGQRVVTSPIAFTTVRRSTDQLPVGRTEVESPGTPGELLSIYEDTLSGGRRVDTRLVSRTVTVPAQPRVILVGTAVPVTSTAVGMFTPAPLPTSVPGGSTGSPSSAPTTTPTQPEGSGGTYGTVADATWDRLASCESTNDWHVNTGNGYYGGLQFDLTTWHQYGGTGSPDQHTREEQIAVANRLHADRGFYPWPVCGRRLGLIPTS